MKEKTHLNWSVGNFLLACFIFIFLLMVFWIKILGSSDVPVDMEKQGYCKQFGEDWENIKGVNTCRNKFHFAQDIKDIEFTEQDFKNYCPKNKFFSTQFYSNCFHKSRGI